MTKLKYVSWFSGIGGFDLAFNRAGHECVGACEIEPHARKVYEARLGKPAFFPNDITKVKAEDIPDADIWVGGFPCQDISIAGKRAGIHAGRSGLVFDLLRLATVKKPRMILLENVPGLLSGQSGEDGDDDGDESGDDAGKVRPAEAGVDEPAGGSASWFGALLGALADAGYGSIAYRVLDARHFGVAQRRRRVFIVAHIGEGADPSPILLELEGGVGNPAAGGEAREGSAAAARGGAAELGGDIAGTLGGGSGKRGWCDDLDRAGAFPVEDAAYFEPRVARNGRGAPDAVAAPLKARSGEDGRGDAAPHVFSPGAYGGFRDGAGTLRARDSKMSNDTVVVPAVTAKWAKGTGGPSGDEAQNLVMDSGEVAATLRESDGHHGRSSPRGDGCDNLVAYQGQGSNIGPMGTLRAGNGNATGGVPFVAQPALCIEDPGRKMSGGSEVGLGVQEEIAYTLQAGARHAVAQPCDAPVPYNIHSAHSCAKERHAYPTEHARALDGNGGFAANQGGTIVGISPQEPMAVGENVRNELRLMPHTTALAAGGGKPGQGYQAVLLPPSPKTADEDGPYPTITCETGKRSARDFDANPPLLVEGDSAASTPDLPRLRAGCGRGGETAIVTPPVVPGFDRTGGETEASRMVVAPALRTNPYNNSDPGMEARMLVQAEPDAFYPHSGLDQAVQRGVSPPLTIGTGQKGRANPPAVMAFSSKDDGRDATEDLSPTLRRGSHKDSHANAGVPPAIAAAAPTLRGFGHGWQGQHNDDVARVGLVRRLTPTECERLQAFPDGWTCLCGCQPYSTAACKCPDGPRYRALGNAVCVGVVYWIARRLAMIPLEVPA